MDRSNDRSDGLPHSITPLILCGGTGTRMWPTSRKAFPKQFANLLGGESLFQATLRRFTGPLFGAPVVATSEDFRFLVLEQTGSIGLADPKIILEPLPRDTAPAILAATLIQRETPEALILVTPSDHFIGDPSRFVEAIELGVEAAQRGQIVTFGVAPDAPETGYGYLETKSEPGLRRLREVVAFVEKPNVARAQEMLESGRFLWNAGVFLYRVGDMIAAFERHAPDLVGGCQQAIDLASQDLGFTRLDEGSYRSVRSVSIDYAVMEKTTGITAVPLECGWSDLGTWKALWKSSPKSEAGNATSGSVTQLDCERTLLRSEDDGIHVLGVGLRNIVAVAMRDAVLIADLERDQEIKEAVAKLKAVRVPQAEQYPRFHRPWGWYETLCLGQRFQVKRIMVKPGGILSLQSHLHRSEHWIVVSGTAKVTVSDRVQLLTENESIYVPLGAIHRMENPGRVPMYLIEVQTGAYLAEDDIVRYEDVYRRPTTSVAT